MTTIKHVFASTLLLAACGSDPLDPGAGDDPGTGTRTLFVDGRISAEPRFANAKLDTDFRAEVSIRVALNDQPVNTGSVTITSRFATTPLRWESEGTYGRWVGAMAGYDEVYQLDIISGAHEVRGVIVDGPDIHVFTSPAAGATLDSTVQNPVTWKRGETADIATFDADEIDRLTIADTGTFMMGVGVLKADDDEVRENRLEVRRTNRIAPAGAVAGSDFAVMIRNELTVLAAPNPAL
jgi:hypothetical protein